MRVLHLIDPQSPDGGPCTLRLLGDAVRRLDAIRHDVLVIGSAADAALAWHCGVEPVGWLCPPRVLPWAGAAVLRRFVQEAGCGGVRYDVIHAWTARMAGLARLAAGPMTPQLATLHCAAGEGLGMRWALRLLDRSSQGHATPLLAASPAVRRAHRTRGVANQRLALLPPAVDPDSTADHRDCIDGLAVQVQRPTRDSIRARWAEENEIDADMFIVGLLGEPLAWSDAAGAGTIAARLALSGRRVRLVLHPAAANRAIAQRALDRLDLSEMIILDELLAQPWTVIQGMDAALMLRVQRDAMAAPSILPLLWAQAAGVPVVAERCDDCCDLIEDGVTGFLAGPGDINAACDRLARLYDDRDLAQRLGENARHVAADMFNIEAYAVRLRHAYELLLADRAVRTIETTAT